MKRIEKSQGQVAIIVQSRLNSERVPRKMIKPFCGSSLLDILLNKLTTSSIIPSNHIFLSVHEQELIEVGEKHKVNIYKRSQKSANEEKDLKTILEWHDKLPENYKYFVSFSGTAPLLKRGTMENFYTNFLNSDIDGMYGVFKKKTYYWDAGGNATNGSNQSACFNTKHKDFIYEAGHCMSASKLNIIAQDKMVSLDFPEKINPFVINEIESWDIDEPWQFSVGEVLYKNLIQNK